MKRRRDRDAWLFLTPEMEREAPLLVSELAAVAGIRGRDVESERMRIEELVHRGSGARWMEYLRDCREVLERARAHGGDEQSCRRLALILREQHLLAPGTRDPAVYDEVEGERVARLVQP